ncbi:MAG: hypothetical protein M5U22_13435 [Thermoleophilia bacterium]|nr:hypothetical protein [Thermoleophilia bacterium]
MAVFDLKIINGTLVIPGTGKVRAGVGVKDGKVVVIDAEDKLGDATRTVDAAGKYVIPGVIDPHVHLGIFTGDFGYECEHETRAALAGGVTTIGVFMGGGESYVPALSGLIDTVEAKSSTDVFFHLSMFTPDQLDEIPRYIDEFGVTSFKFYMCGVKGVFPNVPDDFILDGLKRLKIQGATSPGVCTAKTRACSMRPSTGWWPRSPTALSAIGPRRGLRVPKKMPWCGRAACRPRPTSPSILCTCPRSWVSKRRRPIGRRPCSSRPPRRICL